MVEAAFRAEHEKEFSEFAQGLEDEADREGIVLMELAGFDSRVAAPAMLQILDWKWALDYPEKLTHRTPADRAEDLRRAADQISGQP